MVEDRAHRQGGPSEICGPSSGGGADPISALPDGGGASSRRWRGLWTCLPDLVFRDVAPGLLLAALSSLGAGGVPISLLDIHVSAAVLDKVRANSVSPRTGLRSSLKRRPTNYVSPLLRAAAKLSPAAFRFNQPHHLEKPFLDVDLSTCFQGTTSIELHVQFLCFLDPMSELPALQ